MESYTNTSPSLKPHKLLPLRRNKSSIVFGDSAISRTAWFTPLLFNPKLNTFYYLELLGISVEGRRVRGVTPSLVKLDLVGNGGIIIDSGTSVNRLTQPAYLAFGDAFKAGASNLKRAPKFWVFALRLLVRSVACPLLGISSNFPWRSIRCMNVQWISVYLSLIL